MKITTIRFNESDLALVELLRRHLGVTSRTEIIRLALRRLAASEGIKQKKVAA